MLLSNTLSGTVSYQKGGPAKIQLTKRQQSPASSDQEWGLGDESVFVRAFIYTLSKSPQ
jgi:hypothetical protein